MSDRIKGFVVTLDDDYKDEDADRIREAIRMVKGVVDVSPSMLEPGDLINRSRVRRELEERILEALNERKEAGASS